MQDGLDIPGVAHLISIYWVDYHRKQLRRDCTTQYGLRSLKPFCSLAIMYFRVSGTCLHLIAVAVHSRLLLQTDGKLFSQSDLSYLLQMK